MPQALAPVLGSSMRMQAASAAPPWRGTSGGRVARHASRASGQRLAKGQPGGSEIGLGISPSRRMRSGR
jgi:hypothetical protein